MLMLWEDNTPLPECAEPPHPFQLIDFSQHPMGELQLGVTELESFAPRILFLKGRQKDRESSPRLAGSKVTLSSNGDQLMAISGTLLEASVP